MVFNFGWVPLPPPLPLPSIPNLVWIGLKRKPYSSYLNDVWPRYIPSTQAHFTDIVMTWQSEFKCAFEELHGWGHSRMDRWCWINSYKLVGNSSSCAIAQSWKVLSVWQQLFYEPAELYSVRKLKKSIWRLKYISLLVILELNETCDK